MSFIKIIITVSSDEEDDSGSIVEDWVMNLRELKIVMRSTKKSLHIKDEGSLRWRPSD